MVSCSIPAISDSQEDDEVACPNSIAQRWNTLQFATKPVQIRLKRVILFIQEREAVECYSKQCVAVTGA